MATGMRRRLEREAPERLTLKMWAFRWLTYLAIAGMVAVIGAMAFVADVRPQLWWSLGSLAVVLGLAYGRTRAAPQRAPRGLARASGGGRRPARG